MLWPIGPWIFHQSHDVQVHWYSGCSEKELVAAKERALLIDCAEVLRKSAIDNSDVHQRDSDILTFVINHDKKGSAQIRKIIKENQEIINHLFGKEIKIVVAERRNPNTASILFAKSAFAQEICEDHFCFWPPKWFFFKIVKTSTKRYNKPTNQKAW